MFLSSINSPDARSYPYRFDRGRRPHVIGIAGCSDSPATDPDRAHILCLNAQGWTVPAIAEIFECQLHDSSTVAALAGAGVVHFLPTRILFRDQPH